MIFKFNSLAFCLPSERERESSRRRRWRESKSERVWAQWEWGSTITHTSRLSLVLIIHHFASSRHTQWWTHYTVSCSWQQSHDSFSIDIFFAHGFYNSKTNATNKFANIFNNMYRTQLPALSIWMHPHVLHYGTLATRPIRVWATVFFRVISFAHIHIRWAIFMALNYNLKHSQS